ncbi:MAG: hypothetical protein ACYCS8_10480 [Acidithiobacillus sp.]
MADMALDIGYREMSFNLGNIARILNEKEHHLPKDTVTALREFHAVATESGMGDDGFFRLTLVPGADRAQAIRQTTEVLRSMMRGECTEFVEDFQ